MPRENGKFIWYDVITSDPPAAEFFYCDVVGWEAKDSELVDDYTVFHAGSQKVGGILPIPEGAATRSGWRGYISVENVDLYAERLTAAGGILHHGPADIPTVGRFAVCADPQGAVFILFKGASDWVRHAAPVGTPGHVGWHELHANAGDQAFAFYQALFGWTKLETIDMGAAGAYQIFGMGNGQGGGMLTVTSQTEMPFWLYYFNVEALTPALERVRTDGGQVLSGPSPVPGGSLIAQCLDPQGAIFALVEPKYGSKS